ncbi:hypothetical protein [Aromatoleum toluclasticum]|uniref:hypothetical protein n=1 Tax=Aromatoleum toluclasticum TaxID=92003 RepID=UPI0012F7BED9|nr:hypothetical protein [Aromatoleum toluclasticum]
MCAKLDVRQAQNVGAPGPVMQEKNAPGIEVSCDPLQGNRLRRLAVGLHTVGMGNTMMQPIWLIADGHWSALRPFRCRSR